MPEIQLPTKSTQDAIKQDTTTILSNFPVKTGTDFNNRTLLTTSSIVGSHLPNLILNVNGKGLLHFILYTHATIGHKVTFQIDNGPITELSPNIVGQIYPFVVGFSSNLKVYASHATVFTIIYSIE